MNTESGQSAQQQFPVIGCRTRATLGVRQGHYAVDDGALSARLLVQTGRQIACKAGCARRRAQNDDVVACADATLTTVEAFESEHRC